MHVNRFQRIFVCVATALNAAFGVEIGFSAVDACFSKHAIYRDGFLHVLTTRDGNNRVLPIAWAICETESGDTYDWFADQCHAAGCGRYLNRAHSVVYSDRQKGIEKFFQTKVNHEHTYQYMLNRNKVATHGFKTSQIVECINGVFVEDRHFTPYHLNNKLLSCIVKRGWYPRHVPTTWLCRG